MNTKEIVISDGVMEVLKRRAHKENVNLEDLVERYILLITDLNKSVPQEILEMQRRNRVLFGDADIDLKEEFANAMYKKYVG